MKKAVGFIRTGKRKSDMERQQRAIEAYCLKEDMEIVDWISGSDFGNVAYGNWMGHRHIDAVVAATNDDVTENVFEFYAYRCKLRMRNSNLAVAEWTGYPGYRVHQKIFEEFTDVLVRQEFENEPVRNVQNRVRKARKGGYIGGQAPTGYKVVGGRLEVNEDEVPVVMYIMERKHSGKTMLSTVDALNAGGYNTRSGKPFVISTVQGIWNNEKFYQGYYKVKETGEWVKGQHEAILSE